MILAKLSILFKIKPQQLLFNFIILFYGLLILYFNYNYYPPLTYGLILIIYIAMIRYHNNEVLSTIIDYLFISFILDHKTPIDTFNFVLLIIPLINRHNYSRVSSTFLPFILSILAFSLLYIESLGLNPSLQTFLNLPIQTLKYITALFSVWILCKIVAENLTLLDFNEDLNTTMVNLCIEQGFVSNPKMIYNGIIDVLNRNLDSIIFKDLICFRIKMDKIILINGSNLILDFKFDNPDFIKSIRKKRILINEPISHSGKSVKDSLIIYSKIEDEEYLYSFTATGNIPYYKYYSRIGLFQSLNSIFSILSIILANEKKIQEHKIGIIAQLSERSQYVSRANKTMHFIRNRLGPIRNLITMIENLDKITKDYLPSFTKQVFDENARAKFELDSIAQRASNMLDKNNNPFYFNITKKVSLESIYLTLNNNFLFFFPEESIQISTTPITNKFVIINEEGFEVFLSDWLSNMRKNKKREISCEFISNNNFLYLLFKNDHSQDTETISKIIQDLTSENKNEIIKRTTHGLYTIKTTLEDMNIPFEVSHDKLLKEIEFKLILKIYTSENINF